jgi:peptide deformylase
MAVLSLTSVDDPVLHQKAKRVRRIDGSIEKLIDDMIDTMHATGGAAGLAAPQVGVPLQVIVVEMPDEEPVAIINPEIVKSLGEHEVGEGCLSIPGYRGTLKRSEKVTVKGRDVFVDRLESMDDLHEIGAEQDEQDEEDDTEE